MLRKTAIACALARLFIEGEPGAAPGGGTAAAAPAPEAKKDEKKDAPPAAPGLIPGSKAWKAAQAAEKLKNGQQKKVEKKDEKSQPKKLKKEKVMSKKKAKGKKVKNGAEKKVKALATYPACSKKNPYREGSMKAKAFAIFAKGGTRASILNAIGKLGASDATASTWVQRFRGFAAAGGEK